MVFVTKVSGIPCLCKVIQYFPATQLRINGLGFGDVVEPEPESFEYQIFTTEGKDAPWLERKLMKEDTERLLAEYKRHVMEEYNALGVY